MKPIIPEAALEQHIAVLGKTGSGKTSTAKLIVEQVVPRGARVCVLDPIKNGEGGGLTLNVQQITLDDLVFGDAVTVTAPTHLKIDVDGHELGVLAGAERTLTEGPVKEIMLEVKLSLGERCSDLLKNWGWTRKAIYDQRKGQRIVGIRYEHHVKER